MAIQSEDSAPIQSVSRLDDGRRLIELGQAMEAVDRAQQAFKLCDCGVCHGRLVLAKKQLATLEASHV